MTDFEILRDLIRDEAFAAFEVTYGKKTLVLEEPGQKGTAGYSLEIKRLPDEVIAFKADLFPATKGFFRNTRSECKRADYILLARDDERSWILFIEMKGSGTGSLADIQAQLQGAQCLVAYCRSVGKRFWGEPEFLQKEDYQQRFISIRNISVPKKPTMTPPASGSWDRPEEMLKINAPSKGRLEFPRLVGRR